MTWIWFMASFCVGLLVGAITTRLDVERVSRDAAMEAMRDFVLKANAELDRIDVKKTTPAPHADIFRT